MSKVRLLDQPHSTNATIGEFLHFTAVEGTQFQMYFQDGTIHPVEVTKRAKPLSETTELVCTELGSDEKQWCIYANITNKTPYQDTFDVYAVAVVSGQDYQIEEVQPITDSNL